MKKFIRGSKVRIRKGAVLVKWNAVEKRDMQFCLLDTQTVHRVEGTTFGRSRIRVFGEGTRPLYFRAHQLEAA